VLGKPAPTFFKLAVEGLQCAAEDVMMRYDLFDYSVPRLLLFGFPFRFKDFP
jgi:hypothetical protein